MSKNHDDVSLFWFSKTDVRVQNMCTVPPPTHVVCARSHRPKNYAHVRFTRASRWRQHQPFSSIHGVHLKILSVNLIDIVTIQSFKCRSIGCSSIIFVQIMIFRSNSKIMKQYGRLHEANKWVLFEWLSCLYHGLKLQLGFVK